MTSYDPPPIYIGSVGKAKATLRMNRQSLLQRGGFEILFQSIYLGEINTQHCILGSNEFLLQRKDLMLK